MSIRKERGFDTLFSYCPPLLFEGWGVSFFRPDNPIGNPYLKYKIY